LKNELKSSKEAQSLILNAISDPIIQHDNHMKIIWWNGAAQKIFDLKKDRDIGLFCHERLFSKEEKCSFCPAIEAKKTGKPKHSEIIDKAGKIWDVKGYALTDEKKGELGGFEICRDITHIKKGQKAFLDYATKLQFHSNNTPVAVIEWDLDFNVIKCNSAAEKMFGYTSKELVGTQAVELLIKENSSELKQITKEVCEEENEFMTIQKCQTKRGDIIDCEWYIFSMSDEKKNIHYIISFINNISIQEEAQKNLQKAREEIKLLADYYRMSSEEEKKRIARNIYGDLSQIMILINENIERLNSQAFDFINNEFDRNLLESKRIIDSAIHSVRKITRILSPVSHENFDLINEVQNYTLKLKNENKFHCEPKFNKKIIVIEKHASYDLFHLIKIFLDDLSEKTPERKAELTVIIESGYAAIIIKHKGPSYYTKKITERPGSCVESVYGILNPHNGKLIFTEDDDYSYIRILLPVLTYDSKN